MHPPRQESQRHAHATICISNRPGHASRDTGKKVLGITEIQFSNIISYIIKDIGKQNWVSKALYQS